MKKTKWMLMSAIILTLAVTFAGCSDDSTSSSDSGLYFHVPFPDDSYFDRVESISLTITAADIDSPITAMLPDSMISGETQADIRMNVAAGDARHYDLQAFDSDDQCLYRNQGDFDIASGRIDISITLRPNGMGSPSRVKLFRNFPPFGEPSQPESILVSLGFSQGNGADQYQVLNSSQMGSAVLSPGIDLVILQSSQDTIFYQDYIDASASFDEFVQDGGAMLFFYTALNYIDSIAGTTFPAGVEFTPRWNAHNDVIMADHPITAGLEQELDGGSSASNGYFSNLPANSLVLTAETGYLVPTMFVFSHGSGTIILCSQPLEYFRFYRSFYPTMGGILSRVIRFMLGYDPTPGEIPGPNLLPPGNSSSAISANER